MVTTMSCRGGSCRVLLLVKEQLLPYQGVSLCGIGGVYLVITGAGQSGSVLQELVWKPDLMASAFGNDLSPMSSLCPSITYIFPDLTHQFQAPFHPHHLNLITLFLVVGDSSYGLPPSIPNTLEHLLSASCQSTEEAHLHCLAWWSLGHKICILAENWRSHMKIIKLKVCHMDSLQRSCLVHTSREVLASQQRYSQPESHM